METPRPAQKRRAGPQTPELRRSKRTKQVRFSDPGPQTTNIARNNGGSNRETSTGLTPAVARTRLGPIQSDPSSPSRGLCKGTRRLGAPNRRRSAPEPQTNTAPELRWDLPRLPETPRSVQFLPFHDILDTRTIRRISRSGFSEAMNEVHEKKRDQERRGREKDEEIRRLRLELDRLKETNLEMEQSTTPDTPERSTELLGMRRRVEELQHEINQHEPMTPPPGPSSSPCLSANGDDEMVIATDDFSSLAEGMVTMSSSPAFPRHNAVTPLTSPMGPAEYDELEDRRTKEREFFTQWRSFISPRTRDTAEDDRDSTSSGSPPANLLEQVVEFLHALKSRESNASNTADNIYKELSSHGFEGNNPAEVIANITAHFRQASIDLERAFPGETANASSTDWKRIIDSFLERIDILVREAAAHREQLEASTGHQKALRGQFNTTLLRLEKTEKKNENLEQAADSMAEDMLHARMKMQAMEKEQNELETDKGRLAASLEKYRTDLQTLETLTMKLEDEALQLKEEASDLAQAKAELKREVQTCKEKVSQLEQDLSNAQRSHDEMQSSLEQCNQELSNLKAAAQSETERKSNSPPVTTHHENEIPVQSQQLYEEEIGRLNVKVSLLETKLDEARNKAETAQRKFLHANGILEEFESLHERAKNIFDKRNRGNIKLQKEGDDDCQASSSASSNAGCDDEDINDSTTMNEAGFASFGSEPITPACETRFKNVELERGSKRKKRRHPDSGIGMIVEENE